MNIGDYMYGVEDEERSEKKTEFLEYVIELEQKLDLAEQMLAHNTEGLSALLLELEELQLEAEEFASPIGKSQSLTNTRMRIGKIKAKITGRV